MRTLVILALAVVDTALATPVPKELKKSDAELLRGVWIFADYDNGGRRGVGSRWYFEADKLYTNGQNTTDFKGTKYEFVLRPEKIPAEIDFASGPDAVWSGIYKFVGDELYVAYSSGAIRPKDFASAPGRDVTILRRAPEAKN